MDVQNPVDLPPYARPQPDLMLLRPPEALYSGRYPTAADVLLVVEVADTSPTYDRDTKIPLYARAGIPEAWLVNLVHGVILVYREPMADGYRVVQTAGAARRCRRLPSPTGRSRSTSCSRRSSRRVRALDDLSG